ncbi:hypothetical protein [Polyangium sp. y55x31]|uniref:hypothetical protein n=1 Tax=Polyangium sp. y55x31 TaxID=3042688 RepID=UPI0024829486|nr:hypothetical protein [Polyangium sp. y55x31]MDI1477155.1 hypothetical protein [Polyangium sp. y55x31]
MKTSRFQALFLVALVHAACGGGSRAETPRLRKVPRYEDCPTVVIVAGGPHEPPFREDPRAPCMLEMIYAALLRAGYLAYRERDYVFPEVQPVYHVLAILTLESNWSTGGVVAALELSNVQTKAKQVPQLALEKGEWPTEADIEALLSIPGGSPWDVAAPRWDQGCVDRDRVAKPRDPEVADVCAPPSGVRQ